MQFLMFLIVFNKTSSKGSRKGYHIWAWKERALKWFTSLDTNSIRSWNDMQKIFLEKYKDLDLKE